MCRKFIMPVVAALLTFSTPLSSLGEELKLQPSPGSTNQPKQKQILVLKTYQLGLPIPDSIDRGLLSALREGGISVADVFVENLDLTRAPGKEHRANLAALLRQKMANKDLGIVIVEGAPAVDFMASEGEALFPGSVILTLIAPETRQLADGGHKVLDIPWKVDPEGTLSAGIKMFPNVKRVLVVTGARDGDLPFLEEAKKAFAPWSGKLDIEFTNLMTYEEMLRRVSALPRDGLIIYSPFFTDTTGRPFVPAEVLGKVIESSPVPVFATLEAYLGRGIVGGSLLKTEDIGKLAGTVTLDYLKGKIQLDKPVTTFGTPARMMFDLTEVNRWNANPEKLPVDSIMINRPQTLWGQYKSYVILATLVCGLLFSIIIVLIAMNRRLKRLKELADEGESRFRIMIEHAPEAIVILEADKGKTVEANKKAEELFGCTRERLFQVGPPEFYTPEQPDGLPVDESIRDNRLSAMRGEEIRVERSIKSQDGIDRFCELRLVSIPFKGQRLLRASFVDISERKKAEETIRNSEILHRTILNTAVDGFWIVNMRGRLMEVNESYCKTSGYSQEELVGMHIFDIDIHETREKTHAHAQKILLQGEDRFDSQHRRKDGTLFDVSISVKHFPFEDGRLVVFLQDITERKKALEKNSRLEGELHQAQKMEAVGRLAGGVAHDFNNMLGVILGHSELALEQTDPTQPIHEDLVEIRDAAKRSADLTRQLLAFARKQTVSPRVLNLNDAIAGMHKMLNRLIGEEIELVWRPNNDDPLVKIDPSQLDQILANLCLNARDAIAGAGTVTIETGTSSFDETDCELHQDCKPGDYAMMAVSDSGSGIEKAVLARLFEPFFTTKEMGKGTGLGLATVYGIIRQNGGFISVYSEMGKGTTFKIYLPAQTAISDQELNHDVDINAMRGSETVLLVEDEPALMKLNTKMLEGLGYKVLRAPTPAEAVAFMDDESNDISLLITDVVMPEMNGKDLSQKLQEVHPNLKCLFMSGYTANVIAHHGFLDEGVNFIPKPFTQAELAKKVRQVLDD